MNRLQNLTLSLVAGVIGAGLAGCDREAETAASDSNYNEQTTPVDPAMSAGDVDSEVISDQAQQASNGYSVQDTDAISGDVPAMAEAHYEHLDFTKGSSMLTDDARQKLANLAKNLNGDEQIYLTIRVQDNDTIEATEPKASLEAMTQPRAQVIRSFLEDQGIEVAKVGIDTAGEVANFGESSTLARPDDPTQVENPQYVVITISETEEVSVRVEAGGLYALVF